MDFWYRKAENNQVNLRVELFLSTTCPHCHKADAFLRDLQIKKPWLLINRYQINQDKTALEHFHQLLTKLNSNDYAVPTVFFCNSRWVGFDSVETSGLTLEKGLDYCHQQITKAGYLSWHTVTALRQLANANLITNYFIHKPHAAISISLFSLLNAFSCSFFIMVALFSFLWLYKENRKILPLGFLFIIIVALVRYFQQADVFLFYQVFSWFRGPGALIGLGLIIYVVSDIKRRKLSLGIPAFLVVAFTALGLSVYQQNCLPNFSLIFNQWLNLQSFSWLQQQLYLLLYRFIDLLPLILLMFFVFYYRVYKKSNKYNTYLINFSCCFLFIIALLFVFYPQGFTMNLMATMSFVLSLLGAWITRKLRPNLV